MFGIMQATILYELFKLGTIPMIACDSDNDDLGSESQSHADPQADYKHKLVENSFWEFSCFAALVPDPDRRKVILFDALGDVVARSAHHLSWV